MKILVSACLLGENCKYNGGNNYNPAVAEFVKGREVLAVCPEMMAGMGCPRTPIEIVDGVLMDRNGNNVDAPMRKAVADALEFIRKEDIRCAILQSRSPTCGVNQIYDGSFSGKLISGSGIFAQALKDAGYLTIDAEDIMNFCNTNGQEPMPNRKHLFLTGPKQIGKSTVLRKLLQDRDAKIGGFRTVRILLEDGASIHMVAPTETAYTDENRIFSRRKRVLYIDPSDFDRIGCGLLANVHDCDLILMDELGPNEANSEKFRQAVWNVLNGERSVYGVLQVADSEFLDAVASRPDVQVITVSEENRDNMPRWLLEQGW